MVALFAWAHAVWLLLTWTATVEQLLTGAALAAACGVVFTPLGPVVAPWSMLRGYRLCALPALAEMLKSAHACEAFGLNYEIHSYGLTLNLAMYLNVALAIRNCDFAEIMGPQNLLGIGMADLPTIDDKGYISAPQKPGLGYDIDRDKVEELTLQRF
jgi:hypothetical protein